MKKACSALLASATLLVAAPLFGATSDAVGEGNGNVTVTGMPDDYVVDTTALEADRRTVALNIRDCEDLWDDEGGEVTVTWNLLAPVSPDGSTFVVKLQVAGESCDFGTIGAATGDVCELIQGASALNESNNSVDVESVKVAGDTTTRENCHVTGGTTNVTMAFIHTRQSGDSDDLTTPEIDEVVFSLNRDRPPTVANLTLGNPGQRIQLDWDEVGEAERWKVYHTTERLDWEGVVYPERLPDTVNSTSLSDGDSSSGSIDGLSIGVPYWFAVVAVDTNGNESELPTEWLMATPELTEDFFETYKTQGGRELGGYCAAGGPRAPSAPLAALVLLGLLGLGRRRLSLRAAAAPLVAAVLLAPSAADAGIRMQSESPQSSAFEFKLGSWQPSIDDEFDGAGPYDLVFGNKRALHLEVEYDYQFWQGFGSAGAFVAVGHSAVRGNATTLSGETSSDSTRLRTMPLRLGLVYRFDVLAERFNVPLAVSVKAGLDYYLWWTTGGNGISDWEDASGDERALGRGATTGYHAAFAIHLLLDMLAPDMATSFDNNVGVNNTYLFAEVLLSKIDDFGGADSWDLSDTSLLFGLAFEF